MGHVADPSDIVTQLLASWNRRDSDSFVRLFSPTAEYTSGRGETYVGRAEIERLVSPSDPLAPVALVGAPAIQRSGSAAVVTFGWSLGGQTQARRGGVITCELSFGGETGWQIERLRNREARPSRRSGQPNR